MPHRPPRVGVALLFLVGAVGCERPLLHPLPELRQPNDTADTAPAVTLDSVEPTVATVGTEVTITISADRAVDSCAASVGEQAATCADPAIDTCVCTLTIEAGLAEGTVTVDASATLRDRTGAAIGELQIDSTAPDVVGANFEVIRRPLGTDDGVRASAGASSEPTPAYDDQAVTRYRFWAAATGGEPLLEVTPAADGAVDDTDLPGTTGETTPSPSVVFVSAVDVAGNESDRTAIDAGSGGDGPVGDAAQIVINRQPVGTADSVGANDGAFTSVCALDEIELLDGDDALLAAVPASVGGGFAPTNVGTPDAAPAVVAARGIDKCGNIGMSVDATGSDEEGPAVSAANLSLVRRAIGMDDAVTGAAGAITTTGCAAATVNVRRESGELLGEGSVAADGSFAAVDLAGTDGTTDPSVSTALVEGVDKCGNVTATGVAVTDGADADGPAVDGTLVTAVFGPGSTDASMTGAAGTVSDTTSALRALHFYDASDATTPAVSATPAADGSFAATTFPSSPAHIYLEGEDKVGNRTATRVLVGNVDVAHRPDQVIAYEDAAGPLAVFAFVAEEDPRTLGPALGQHLARPTTGSALDAFGAADDANVLGTTGAPPVAAAAAWVEVTTTASPPARIEHVLASIGDALYAFGGRDDTALRADSWALGGDWVEVSTTGPIARSRPAASFDGLRGRMVLFGGDTGVTSMCSDDPLGVTSCDDTWTFDGTTWTELGPSTHPPARYGHAMAYDARRDVVVLFGGYRGTGVNCFPDDGETSEYCDDTWELRGGEWIQVMITPPARRAGHSLVYDAAAGEVVLFGGENETGQFGDTWTYDGIAWTVATPAAPPSARSEHLATFDPLRGEVVVFGGFVGAAGDCGGGSPFCGDTWAWNGSEWTLAMAPDVDTPPIRSAGRMAFHPPDGRSMLFAGGNNRVGEQFLADTWAWAGDAITTGRFAAHALAVPLLDGADVTALDVTYVGVGSGTNNGTQTVDGVELFAWDHTNDTWIALGAHAASSGGTLMERTIAVAIDIANTQTGVVDGPVVWLMAVSGWPSSATGGAVDATLSSDAFDVSVSYEVQP
jgi:hypothetical protein